MTVCVTALSAEEERHIASLFTAILGAESAVISAIERECEALRAGHHLAAKAIHVSLRDAARRYVSAVKAARGCVGLLNEHEAEAIEWLETRRRAFAAVLRIELSTLMAECARMEADRYEEPRRAVAA